MFSQKSVPLSVANGIGVVCTVLSYYWRLSNETSFLTFLKSSQIQKMYGKNVYIIFALLASASMNAFVHVEGSQTIREEGHSMSQTSSTTQASSSNLDEIKDQLKDYFEEKLLRELLQEYHDEIDELKGEIEQQEENPALIGW